MVCKLVLGEKVERCGVGGDMMDARRQGRLYGLMGEPSERLVSKIRIARVWHGTELQEH